MADVMDRLEAALAGAGLECGSGPSALKAAELQQVAQRAWSLIQRVQGSVLLPIVAEADNRRLFGQEEYASASSMRDLLRNWLRCHPAIAGRLLDMAKRCVSGGFGVTGEALATGEIDIDHAHAIVRSVRRLPAGVMEEADYRRAESTMLDTARAADAEVTAMAGKRLMEVEAAQECADRQAERDRVRAEESRWFEVTGIGIAGCKEIRLRAESDVIDGFVRVMTGLVEPSIVDEPGERNAGVGAGSVAYGVAGTADGQGVMEVGASATPSIGDRRDASALAARGVRTGSSGQAPGSIAEGRVNLTPIERRRADAAVEVIDAIAGPDVLDDLTSAAETGRFARYAVRAPGSSPRKDARNDLGDGVGIEVDDAAFDEIVDGGQVTTNGCDPSTDTAVSETAMGDAAMGDAAVRGDQPSSADSVSRPVRTADRAGSGRGRGARVRGERPSLVVIVSFDHREGRRGGLRSGEASSTGAPARLASTTEIERLACEASITPVWMAREATPVTVAAPTRFFRGKQLAALIARDRGCAFPGCSRGLRYAHAHHIRPWSEGGPTTVDNGALLCSHHHRIVHRAGGWLVRMATDGLPEFVPPAWIDPRRQPQRHTRHQTQRPAAA